MELNEDLVMDIISRLPVNLTVRCKVLSKSFNNRLCEPNLSQTYAPRWFQQQSISKLLFYSLPSTLRYGMSTQYRESKIFRKISINPGQRISTTEPLNNVSVLASCNGLLLLQFHDEVRAFCLFNPITGLFQLIPYPEPRRYFKIFDGGAGLVVDNPTSNQYKLVTIGKPDEHEGYKFHVYSSGEPGVWHEFQLRTKLYKDVFLVGQPVYVHDCLHWLRSDGCILAVDTASEHGRIINNHLEIIKLYVKDPMYGIISFRFDACLGLGRGVLTLVCAFKNFIVIFAYDYASSNWRVSYTLANVSPERDYLEHGFPMWFDGKKLIFLARSSSAHEPGYLYEYDCECNTHKKVLAVSDEDTITGFFSFEPTLAYVPKTLPYTVHSKHLPAITTILDELRCLITNKPRVVCEPQKAVNKFPCIN